MSDRYVLSSGALDARPAYVKEKAWEGFVAGLKCIDNASQDLARAGQLFAEIGEADWERIICDPRCAPHKRLLENARACGRGRMVPQLVTAAGSYVSRLRSFPVEDQARYLSEPVEVAVWKAGRKDSVMRMVPTMSHDEVRQVFAKDGSTWSVRSLSEQWAWLEMEEKRKARIEEKASGDEITRPNRWAIRGGRVHLAQAKVRAGLTARDLWSILEDMGEIE